MYKEKGLSGMKKHLPFYLLLFLLAASLALTGCGKEQGKELKMVTAPPYSPFEYYVGDELTGIDIDMMREIARRIGYELKIQPITYNMVIKSVVSGNADVAASFITITEERSKSVLFSVPYIRTWKKIMVLDKSPIRSIEALEDKLVGIQEATTSEPYARRNFKRVVSFPNVEVAVEALENGKIDALVVDSFIAKCLESKANLFRFLPREIGEESHGIAVNVNHPELQKKMNEALKDMLETGWLEECIERHIARFKTRQQSAEQNIQKLKIGIVPSYPPYESKENGVLEGIDVDIIHRICEELGYAPLFVEVSSDTIYSSITSDDITIAISSLTITEKRKEVVDFSMPYSETSQRILVKKGSAFQTREDLKGRSIGAVVGTTSEEQSLLISKEVERYSEPKLLLKALLKNEVDAIVLDDFILKQMTAGMEEFRLLPDILNKEEYGIAVSQKAPELLEKINAVLRKMKQDGSLARIHDKYMSRIVD